VEKSVAAILMALVVAVFVSGIGWLMIGSRFRFDADDRQNDLLNLAAYVAAAFTVSLAGIILWTL
jgi:hypothetical protein